MDKVNDTHEDSDSLLHNKTSHTQCLFQFQNPRWSSSYKIFDGKEVCTHTCTHTHTHTQRQTLITENTKTMYPLHTSYVRGIKSRGHGQTVKTALGFPFCHTEFTPNFWTEIPEQIVQIWIKLFQRSIWIVSHAAITDKHHHVFDAQLLQNLGELQHGVKLSKYFRQMW